jgi:hypothetical protein
MHFFDTQIEKLSTPLTFLFIFQTSIICRQIIADILRDIKKNNDSDMFYLHLCHVLKQLKSTYKTPEITEYMEKYQKFLNRHGAIVFIDLP